MQEQAALSSRRGRSFATLAREQLFTAVYCALDSRLATQEQCATQ